MRNLMSLPSAGVCLLLACAASVAQAQTPIAYPAQGQSVEQQSKDGSECSAWATQNTGMNPSNPMSQSAQVSAGMTGQRLAGAARGAAGGAAIGAIADDDAGKGAAIGAVVGTMAGGRQARRERAYSQNVAQMQQAQGTNTYYRAYAACMQGRGYSIQ
ncbi:MAG TPA: glycine zipper domain-containing protein [Alphaproteobacteria bacterium]|jgi:hypothetical protein